MNSRFQNRSVAGLVVAALALSLAWGTTATAGSSDQDQGAARPALSKAETKAVKRLATRIARTQARRQIRRAAPTLRVASAASADFARTADLATNAQNAANAGKVGGLDVKKFVARVADDGPAVTLVSSNGFTVTASCPAGLPELRAASSVPGGALRTTAIDNNEALRTNGSENLPAAGLTFQADLANGLGTATAEFVAASGEVVSVWIGYRDDAPDCAFFGNHMVG